MTGATATCGPFPSGTRDPGLSQMVAEQREERCISDFQRQGYERVNN